jgi:hypothetical protein
VIALSDPPRAEEFGVFADVLPEDKYALVPAFQRDGHVVGSGRSLRSNIVTNGVV